MSIHVGRRALSSPMPLSKFGGSRASKQADGALAVARMPYVNDASQLRRAAKAHGFEETAKNFFQHPADGSWIGEFANGNIERGVGNTRFTDDPQDLLSSLTVTGKRSLVGTSAVAKLLPKLAHGTFKSHVKDLLHAGFKAKNPVYYEHRDGSWVASVKGKIVTGIRDEQVTVDSFVMMSEAKDPKKLFQKVPSDTWTWFRKNTALGKTPRLPKDESAHATLLEKGYHLVEVHGTKETWRHDDGSWVRLDTKGSVSVGFQKWPLGRLPYNNRTAP